MTASVHGVEMAGSHGAPFPRLCLCVCVCVCKRRRNGQMVGPLVSLASNERERERERKGNAGARNAQKVVLGRFGVSSWPPFPVVAAIGWLKLGKTQ